MNVSRSPDSKCAAFGHRVFRSVCLDCGETVLVQPAANKPGSKFEDQKAFVRMLVDKGGVPHE